MSRTLHYGIDGVYKPDENQAFQIFQLVNKYKNNYEWTAETVDLSVIRFYPDFDALGVEEWNEAEEIINKQILKYVNKGSGFTEAVRKLEKSGLMKTREKNGLRGFTKVSSNELNAHTVIKFVTEASKIIPDQIFYLIDEGFALYCPLHIKGGSARPNYPEIHNFINAVSYNKDSYLKAKTIYYKRLIKQERDFQSIDNFIRPIKTEGYLLNRKEFKTIILNEESIADLEKIAVNKIFSETEESKKYYGDVAIFPE